MEKEKIESAEEKLTFKEKAVAWFKRNWPYVAAGAVGAFAITAGIRDSKPKEEALKVDPIQIEPPAVNHYVIDKGTDKWMDDLSVQFSGKEVTVRQAVDVANYYDKLIDDLNENAEDYLMNKKWDFACRYEDDNPGTMDSIETLVFPE